MKLVLPAVACIVASATLSSAAEVSYFVFKYRQSKVYRREMLITNSTHQSFSYYPLQYM